MIKPKLALIPSGYKGGSNPTVYSILPNDGIGDFDFDRASEGTRVRKDGLIEEVTNNVPRLDWLNSNCPSLLLEPQRSNVLQRSEEFDNSYWSKQGGCTITSDTTIAPNGTLTADTLSGATGTSVSGTVLRRNVIISGNSTLSIYVKSLGSTNFTIYIRNGSNGQVFSQSITPNNSWQRVTLTTDPANGQVFFGNTNGDVAIWGAQLEQGSYPTSYIKTEATSVTRLKDVCLNGGNANLFNVSELSLLIDATNFATPLNNFCYISLTDGQNTPINMIRLTYEETRIIVTVYDNGTFEMGYNITSVTANQRNKLLLTFDGNEAKTYFNGVLKNTSSGVALPSNLDSLSFSNRTESGRHFEGKVHDVRVYDRVLTEEEAIELTTL